MIFRMIWGESTVLTHAELRIKNPRKEWGVAVYPLAMPKWVYNFGAGCVIME